MSFADTRAFDRLKKTIKKVSKDFQEGYKTGRYVEGQLFDDLTVNAILD